MQTHFSTRRAMRKNEPLLITQDLLEMKGDPKQLQEKMVREIPQKPPSFTAKRNDRLRGVRQDTPARIQTHFPRRASKQKEQDNYGGSAQGRGLQRIRLLSILLGTLWEAWAERILYSVLAEADKGSFVGDIAKDLGLEHGVRIDSRGKMQLFALNPCSGSLVTEGRIDPEELCTQSPPCLVNFNILLEDTMNLYPIGVEIIDINDTM
ncbi:Protocadherin gamma-A7 [Plecturocebus cupreus]